MNKLVGVGFQIAAAVVDLLAGSAIPALALHPRVADVTIADVSVLIVELRDAVLAAGILGAVEASTTHHGGQPSNGNTIELMVHNMVYALLLVGNLICQPYYQPLGNLAQKDAALGAGVEKTRVRTLKQLLRQHVEHLVGQLWRSKHFVVAQVC